MKTTRSDLRRLQRHHRRLAVLGHRWWWLFSGLLFGLSFPPSPVPYLAWFAFVPLFVRWSRTLSPYRIVGETYLAWLVAHAVAMHWVVLHAMPSVALVSAAGLLVLPIPYAIAVGLGHWVKERLGTAMGVVGVVLFTMATEVLMSQGAAGFIWLTPGNAFSEALAFVQFAEWTGGVGVTAWVLLVNLSLFLAVYRLSRVDRYGWAGLAVVLALLPLWLGASRLARLPVPTAQVQVGLVQPNDTPERWADIDDEPRLARLIAQTDSLLDANVLPPALVVWPETALPVLTDPTEQADIYEHLQTWAAERNTYLLTGAILTRDWSFALNRPRPAGALEDAPYDYLNSALLFGTEGRVRTASKRKLVPFAEFVPFANVLRGLRTMGVNAGGVAGYVPGEAVRDAELHRINGRRFATFICFESVFAERAQQEVAIGAKFLVVIAQNGWWTSAWARRQHLAFSRLRAVETRRAVVWSTVNGPAGLIHPDGRFAPHTPSQAHASASLAVPLMDERTLFVRLGNWLGAVVTISSVLLVVLAFGLGVIQRRFGK